MPREKKNVKIADLIFNIVVIIIIVILFNIYKINNFNEFNKAEGTIGITTFSRDNKVKCSEAYSYKIESPEFNDAIFYKKSC